MKNGEMNKNLEQTIETLSKGYKKSTVFSSITAHSMNIIEKNIVQAVENFKGQDRGARILLKEVEHPEQYGVPTIVDGKITRIIEKPANPDTHFAVIGIYMYDNRVFDIIDRLEPSHRGELEITDVNNHYLQEGTLTYDILDGWWADCGENRYSLHESGELISKTGATKRDT